MLDVKLILEKPDEVVAALKKKLWDFDPKPIQELSAKRLELLKSVEANKAEQNRLSASVPQIKKEGGDVKAIFAKVKELGAANKEGEAELKKVEAEITSLVEVLPNLPDPDLVGGGKENNHPIYHFGEEQKFDFTPKDHVALAESLGLIDYKRAAKISGTGTWVYTNLFTIRTPYSYFIL